MERNFVHWTLDWYLHFYQQSFPVDHPLLSDPSILLDYYTWVRYMGGFQELYIYLERAQCAYWIKKCAGHLNSEL
jgi:hypothetical protein